MTVETETETETELSPQAASFKELRAVKDRWQERATLAEQALAAAGLQVGDDGFEEDQAADWLDRLDKSAVAAARGALIEAGFDPDEGNGRVLAEKLAAGVVEPDPEAIVGYAEAEYTWRPTMATRITMAEFEQISGAERLEALQSGTSSLPVDYTSVIEAQIAEARERGDFVTASRLQEKHERQTGRRR